MCELCRHNPCSAGCPNAPEPEPVYICDECEDGIYDGDTYYELGGKIYCQGCIDYARQTAECHSYEEFEPDEDRIYDAYRDRQLRGDAEYIISQDIFKEE